MEFLDTDNDDDLSVSESNEIWINNKNIIKPLYTTTTSDHLLINYGKNLILFYKIQIEKIKILLDRKGSNDTKHFIGDVTIQTNQQAQIANMIFDDPSKPIMTEDAFDKMVER